MRRFETGYEGMGKAEYLSWLMACYVHQLEGVALLDLGKEVALTRRVVRDSMVGLDEEKSDGELHS